MTRTTVSACGRFAVLDGLHLDRNVFESLMRWAETHGLQIQDAIQLALCAFHDDTIDPSGGAGGAGVVVSDPVGAAMGRPNRLTSYWPYPRKGSTSFGSGFFAFRTA